MGEIISLQGGSLPTPGEADVELVEKVEWLLEAVKSGAIQGIAVAYLWTDDNTGRMITGVITQSLIGRLTQIQYDIIKQMEN